MPEDAVRHLIEGLFDADDARASSDPCLALSAAYGRLAGVMEPVFGELGFSAMFISSVRATQVRYPILTRVSATAPNAIADSLRAVLREEKPEIVAELQIALLITFYQVLARFIGDDLSTQLFRDAWPPTAPSTASSLPETP